MTERILIVDDERLDKPDVDAITDLNYESAARTGGALVGSVPAVDAAYGGGCLTEPAFNTAAIQAVTISAFYYMELSESSQPIFGRVVRHDPALASQVSTSINLLPYQAPQGKPWIWAKRTQVAMDADTRRKWDIPQNKEVAFSTNTRERVRVEFQVADPGPPAVDTLWTPVAKVVGWVAGVPTIVPKSAWSPTYFDGDPDDDLNGSPNHAPGLAELLYQMRLTFKYHLHGSKWATAASWSELPPRSMVELDEWATLVEQAALATSSAAIMWNSGPGTYTIQEYVAGTPNAVGITDANIVKIGVGHIQITLTPPVVGTWVACGSHADPYIDPNNPLRRTASAQRGGQQNQLLFRVFLFDAANAPYDGAFTFSALLRRVS